MTQPILIEWKKHWSRFSRKWLVAMKDRGKLEKAPDCSIRSLRNALATIDDPHARAALIKDVHLIEAAQSADRIVLSLDDDARRHFVDFGQTSPGLEGVYWCNPVSDVKASLLWLRQGAPHKKVLALVQ